MSFQFQCPQGHLLEGDPSQAGQAVNCPTCGMLFIIPAPLAAPAMPAQMGPSFGPPDQQQPAGRFAHLQAEPAPAYAPLAAPATDAPPAEEPAVEVPAPPPE